ncbi:MAG TPA: alpha/beta hydrolase, partial [Acidimicrobiia bacterium]|nr:alpha/beta hydrolase [Acidimicrobiia bacterium]
ELLARDLDGDLPFSVERRVLSNGSIYIGMAQLSDGQQALLAADDAPIDLAAFGVDPQQGFCRGVAATFSPSHPASEVEQEVQWLFASYADGHKLLPRTIRYIEDRRAEEARFTGAIERHPSPLGVVWGRLDPIAVHAMTDRLLAARPDAILHTLDDVGHYPMVEAPGPFADACLELIAKDV